MQAGGRLLRHVCSEYFRLWAWELPRRGCGWPVAPLKYIAVIVPPGASRRPPSQGKRERLNAPAARMVRPEAISFRLLVDLRFDQPREVSQRFLPAEITGLRRDDVRDA